MNILGQDGGYAPIAPGPIDAARRRTRHQYTKKIKRTPTPPTSPIILHQIYHSLRTSAKAVASH